MRALEFITGHVTYNPAYTYKFQLKTTYVFFSKVNNLNDDNATSYILYSHCLLGKYKKIYLYML